MYINRSVMIMEPMAGATSGNREREERGKFRAGLKRGTPRGSLRRKRRRMMMEMNDHRIKIIFSGSGSGRQFVVKPSRTKKRRPRP